MTNIQFQALIDAVEGIVRRIDEMQRDIDKLDAQLKIIGEMLSDV